MCFANKSFEPASRVSSAKGRHQVDFVPHQTLNVLSLDPCEKKHVESVQGFVGNKSAVELSNIKNNFVVNFKIFLLAKQLTDSNARMHAKKFVEFSWRCPPKRAARDTANKKFPQVSLPPIATSRICEILVI